MVSNSKTGFDEGLIKIEVLPFNSHVLDRTKILGRW